MGERGRPKINADRKRSIPIAIKFSRYDLMRIREKVKDRMAVSTWIRNAVLDKLNENAVVLHRNKQDYEAESQ